MKKDRESGLGNKPIAYLLNLEDEPEALSEQGHFIAIPGQPSIINGQLASFEVSGKDPQTGKEVHIDIAGAVEVDANGNKLVFSEPIRGVDHPNPNSPNHPSKS